MQVGSKDQLSKSGRPGALVQTQLTRQMDNSSQSQLNIQKQIQQLQKQQMSQVGTNVKPQLTEAATNIIANSTGHHAQMVMSPEEGQAQQYDDLKKKLLSEYKKMQKVKGQSPNPNMNNMMILQKQNQKTSSQTQHQNIQNYMN